MDKENAVHADNGILFNLKKKTILLQCIMGEP